MFRALAYRVVGAGFRLEFSSWCEAAAWLGVCRATPHIRIWATAHRLDLEPLAPPILALSINWPLPTLKHPLGPVPHSPLSDKKWCLPLLLYQLHLILWLKWPQKNTKRMFQEGPVTETLSQLQQTDQAKKFWWSRFRRYASWAEQNNNGSGDKSLLDGWVISRKVHNKSLFLG